MQTDVPANFRRSEKVKKKKITHFFTSLTLKIKNTALTLKVFLDMNYKFMTEDDHENE